MQHNLHHKPKHWIRNLAWEAESAISQLPKHQQDYTRYRVAQATDQPYRPETRIQPMLKKQQLQEKKPVLKIKNKLDTNKAVVTKADKGNAMVIIYQQEYNEKAIDFVNNNFSTLNKDPTTAFQQETRKTVTDCTTIIPKINTWKLTNMNPSPLNSMAKLKYIKQTCPYDLSSTGNKLQRTN
jgi:hypothetical protein